MHDTVVASENVCRASPEANSPERTAQAGLLEDHSGVYACAFSVVQLLYRFYQVGSVGRGATYCSFYLLHVYVARPAYPAAADVHRNGV